MSRYRYYTADILTGNVLAEMPLYGVYMSRALNTPGDFTGTFKLGTHIHNDDELLEGTAPGKCALYVERDNTLIWGGIIWSRTYAEESRTCQLTAQTFESIFDRVVLEQDFVHQVEDQTSIFKAVIDAIQNQRYNDFGLDTTGIKPSGILRTVLIPGYEYHYAQEAVDQLVGVENGFDYTIDVLPGNQVDRPVKLVRTGYPILGNYSTETATVYDFPGEILTYWWPESGSQGGTRFVGLGAGAGIAMLRAQRDATELLEEGYPGWYVVNAYKGITEMSLLEEQVAADMQGFSLPVTVPTFELKPNEISNFDHWSDLGAAFIVRIESKRFPEGEELVTRMIGWELTTEDSNDIEKLKFTIESGTSRTRPDIYVPPVEPGEPEEPEEPEEPGEPGPLYPSAILYPSNTLYPSGV